MALGTALKRGASVVASRDRRGGLPDDQARDDRGPNSTGVHVADLRVLPAAVNRHLLKTQGSRPAFHVRVEPADPEVVPDPDLRAAGHPGERRRCEKELEKHYSRRSSAARPSARSGAIYVPGARARDLRARTCSRRSTSTAIRRRAASASSSTTATRPRRSCCRSCSARSASRRSRRTASPREAARDQRVSCRESIAPGEAARDGGRRRSRHRLRPRGERLLPGRRAGQRGPGRAGAPALRAPARPSGRDGNARVPDHGRRASSRSSPRARGLEVVRTPVSLPALTHAAAAGRRRLRRRRRRRLRLPGLPARPTTRSRALCKLLELLAPVERPLSDARRRAARSSTRRPPAASPCPWALKGTVMRVLTERLAGTRSST